MSVSSRLISGTAASWVQIGVNMMTQLALVPLYLTYWNVETYGLWLAVIAFATLVNSLGFGHQEYLGFEFLKQGKANVASMSKYLCSGVCMGIVLSLVQIIFIAVLINCNVIPYLLADAVLNLDKQVLNDAGYVLMLQFIIWLVCGSAEGIMSRALCALGYFPRMAWWGVFAAIIMNITPVIAVVCGAGLLQAGITLTIVRIIAGVPIYFDMFRLLKKEHVRLVSPSVQLGWSHFAHSSVIFASTAFENLRQQGARLFLTPLAGSAQLAAFATMRTGANVAMQGLHTITNPLMPELMRFLHQRDEVRSKVAFSTVWIVSVALMAPALVTIQAFIEPLYLSWTRGRLPFNPLLFAVLSLNVLIYATVQPAISVMKGNNLLKPQILIAMLAAAVVAIGMFVFVPWLGVLGAGIALMLAEIASSILFRMVAKTWLHQHGLNWPEKSYGIALTSIWIAGIAMGSIAWFPEQKWFVLLISLFFLFWNFWRYWQALPLLATERAKGLVGHLPGFKLLFSK